MLENLQENMRTFIAVQVHYIYPGTCTKCVVIFIQYNLLFRKEADGKNYVKYEVIGANNVAVPTHFFKIVVAETENGELHMESYVMPNQVIDNDPALSNFQVF